jgi:hypothetical protein
MHTGTTARSPQGTIEVAILIDGKPQPLYRRPGDGALFVAGTEGQPYTLRVRNLQPSRVEVINTVDGRHTLKDEPGDSRENRGLVFVASSTGDFTGWRISADTTREFVFGAPDHSVAAQATGSQANVGVIGFAAWRELAHVWHNYGGLTLRSTEGNTVPCAATMDSFAVNDMATRSLGTGMGAEQADHVGSTTFTRTSGEPDILVVSYDTRAALDAMGITGPGEPSAFPGIGTGYEKYAAAH